MAPNQGLTDGGAVRVPMAPRWAWRFGSALNPSGFTGDS